MRCKVPPGAIGTKVNEDGGSSESVGPEARWHVCVEEEGTDAIVKSAKNAFRPTILL